MKISLNWLKKLVSIPTTVSNEELIRLIGARLVEVEGVIDETHKYDNIYIVKVKSCEKIPETHLTLCQIDAGKPELIQVVCGAPNVHEGMFAVWIAPGAIVPASAHEDAPFVIGKRKMRGYESCGMLAGADELDFGDDHSGIVEIDPEEAKPGDLLADIFELNDLVLEIENKSLTHRPDCFGMVGFAREVAGILGQSFNEPQPLTEKNYSEENAIKVIIADSHICSRYTAIVLKKHGEMRKKFLSWQDTVLSKSGMKPISSIVDATNYLMLLTGQPLHAFDYDKFVEINGKSTPEIIVRLAKTGEKLILLDEKEIELTNSDIVICAGDKPVALAGAMGGKTTEIDENTQNIIIESATFSLYNLRKTQMIHGIFTESITRFTKGQPAYQTFEVAKACAEKLKEGFQVAGVTDTFPTKARDIVVKITTKEINNLLGTKYNENLIIETLENVGFAVERVLNGAKMKDENQSMENAALAQAEIKIRVPNWRTDIRIKEDIIEEVGRLLGYDNIKPTLPLHATAEKNPEMELKKEIRNRLAKFGANEVLTYSFVSERLLSKVGQDKKNAYKIINSISPELQYVRQSLIPSLLEKTYLNEKLPIEKFAIFEMNKVYQKAWGMNQEKVPVEKTCLGLIVAERKGEGTAFYKAKKYVNDLANFFGIEVEYLPLKINDAEYKMFEPKRAAEIRIVGHPEKLLGVVGEFKNSVRHNFKLAEYLAGFEIDLGLVLAQKMRQKKIDLKEKKIEDLTITTQKNYAETLKEVKAKYPEAEIKPLSIYRADGQTDQNITFRIIK